MAGEAMGRQRQAKPLLLGNSQKSENIEGRIFKYYTTSSPL
jgi:hypothetical protein